MVEADLVDGKLGEVGEYDVEFKGGKLVAKAKVGHSFEFLPGVSLALSGDAGLEIGGKAVLEALRKAGVPDLAIDLAEKALGV